METDKAKAHIEEIHSIELVDWGVSCPCDVCGGTIHRDDTCYHLDIDIFYIETAATVNVGLNIHDQCMLDLVQSKLIWPLQGGRY